MIYLLYVLQFADSRQYSVSGFSSGGFFAHQLHIIHSASITGAGVVAGGPFYCTMSSYNRFQSICKANSYLIELEILVQQANDLSSNNSIDSPSNLTNSKVYIYSGSADTVVYQSVVKFTEEFYRKFITNDTQIVTNYGIKAQHSWITNNAGNPCWYLGPPGVNNCGFDLAGAIFSHIFPKLIPKGTQIKSNLFQFDQSKYTDVWKAGMSNRGFIYVPTFCQNNTCNVHLLFHGCYGSFEINGYSFIYEIGVNDWAESNNIVVIYPQLTAHANNPEGCWDFWGYTGANYLTYSGLQINAVHMMAQSPPIVNWK